MHVRAISVQIQPGKMQELIDMYNNSVVPAQKTQKGYQGSYLMTDADNNKALAISVWESKDDLLATESSSGYFQEQMVKLGSIFAGSPESIHYELSSENSA